MMSGDNILNNLKVIVAGGRDFNDYELLKSKLDYILQNKLPDVEIVSGAARGADSLGERYAKENNLGLHRKPADWDTYGKSAGYRRNAEMADYADCRCTVRGRSSHYRVRVAECKQQRH